MAERFFNWEERPAIIRNTPEGGLEGSFVALGETSWSRASPVEILESGSELSHSAFLEMFVDLPTSDRNVYDSVPSASRVGTKSADPDDRNDQKSELRRRGFSNASSEAWLDRSGYPRPPGWRAVFFYPGSMRPRNAVLFWLGVLGSIIWFAF